MAEDWGLWELNLGRLERELARIWLDPHIGWLEEVKTSLPLLAAAKSNLASAELLEGPGPGGAARASFADQLDRLAATGGDVLDASDDLELAKRWNHGLLALTEWIRTRQELPAGVAPLLGLEEQILAFVRATNAFVAVTNSRVVVVRDQRLAMSIEVAALERIELDVEKMRPAGLTIVASEAGHEPQRLDIPAHELGRAAALIAVVAAALRLI